VAGASREEPTILVVGSTMTDMIAYADRFPDAGETVIGNAFSLGFGGKGANQAVMCTLLGASVRFVGCLGQDTFGEMTLENLSSFGIDTSAVTFTDDAATGAAPIWVDGTGENRIIVVPGANNMLEPRVVDATVRSARADVVLTQLELPEECVLQALRTANEIGSISILNPAPMAEVERDLLGLASWLIPNRSELESIARLLSLPSELGLRELVLKCAAALETDLVVTVGADGVLVCDHNLATIDPVDAPTAAPVDTTGAGDAFVGAFAYAIAIGALPAAAAAFGCACAAASVEAQGTQTSFPRGAWLDEIKQSLRVLTESTQ
jgi:ribokinase